MAASQENSTSSNGHSSIFSGRPRKIGTHSGVFHADEALACFMLMQLPEYTNAEIIRSRDPEVWKKCDILVDVGGVYDQDAFRFDHHQRSFKDTMNSIQPEKPWTIKLSSAGLIFCHFGRRVIAQLLQLDNRNEKHAKDIELIYDKVYETFIMEIDAIDNGVQQSEKPLAYQINTGLSSRVKKFNPRWNEPVQPEDLQRRFMQAVQLTGSEFSDKIDFYRTSWLPARQIVEDALLKRFEIDPSGQIVRLPVGGCPWQDHLLQLEQEQQLNTEQQIKFVLYQDDQQHWRVQAVPIAIGSFITRLPLPEPWRGLINETLSQMSGIPGCIFAHHSGFIGGNTTYDGALAMACKTLNLATSDANLKINEPIPSSSVSMQ
ncbi:MYG1 exonuclease-like isoform X2 [Paramacrobiotus metropolitanus]|uniref:MYG1 exonuclease-like isoform X2 n=1 Tax=Paramacrobiotus metropolitanus TaxID=2943436 RepID=UPI0024462A84|nr:MYG1 exonuclease-like isoform X2 [Paramacrobiotus metropolitanus]